MGAGDHWGHRCASSLVGGTGGSHVHLLKPTEWQSHAYTHDQGWETGTPDTGQPEPSAVCHPGGRAQCSSSLGPQAEGRPGSGGIGQGGGEQSRKPSSGHLWRRKGALWNGRWGEWAEVNQHSTGCSQRPRWAPVARFLTPGLAPFSRPSTPLLLPHQEETQAQRARPAIPIFSMGGESREGRDQQAGDPGGPEQTLPRPGPQMARRSAPWD